MAVKTVNEYLQKFRHWNDELERLHKLFSLIDLDEFIKWGSPTYSLEGKNVVGFVAFKEYVAIWFFQGFYLKDLAGVLINAQEGKTKALRQWRFTSVKEMNDKLILDYLNEAIQNQRQGKEVKIERDSTYQLSHELEVFIAKSDKLKDNFFSLTKGKQKEYSNYINEAKRAVTKDTRLEKIKPMILRGAGLNDKYKNC